MVIGDAGVGKSCLILQYVDRLFTQSFISTLGVDHKQKIEQLGNTRIKVEVWDTVGQERFRTITSSYYKGASGILVVFDITTKSSFEHVNTWLEEIESFACPTHVKALIGNKTDLDASRAVSTQEAEEFAQAKGMLYFETTATEHDSTSRPFVEVVSTILETLRPTPLPADPDIIRLTTSNTSREKPDQGRSNCC